MDKRLLLSLLLATVISLPPAEAFPWKKVLLFPVKVVVAPFKYIRDVAFEVSEGLYLRRVL